MNEPLLRRTLYVSSSFHVPLLELGDCERKVAGVERLICKNAPINIAWRRAKYTMLLTEGLPLANVTAS